MSTPDPFQTRFDPALPLRMITASKTNPRKHFDTAAMAELIESVQTQGIIQPVLVRPHAGGSKSPVGYELVVGERRFRAAQAAKLENIPATIRALTDVEVIEIQIIENLQRADVHPIEEAEGYEQLLKAGDGEYTVDGIAAKVGKSRRYVFNRLALLKLCPTAREACLDGTIDASKGLLLARIENAQVQAELLDYITDTDYRGNFPSYRDIQQHIIQDYMTRLDKAPFDVASTTYRDLDRDDKRLLPACTACPKRSGACPDLFSDIADADTCTDIACFGVKRRNEFERKVSALRSQGHTVVVAQKDVKKIFSNEWSNRPGHEWVWADEPVRGASGKQVGTYASLLRGSLEPTYVAVERLHDVLPIFNRAAADALLLKNKVTGAVVAPGTVQPSDWQKNRAAEMREHELRHAARKREYLAWRERALGPDEDALRFLVRMLVRESFDYGLVPEILPTLYGDPVDETETTEEKLLARIDGTKRPQTMTPINDLMQIAFDLTVDRLLDGDIENLVTDLDAFLTANGADIPAAIAEIKKADADRRAAEAAAARVKPAKKAKK